VLIEELWRKVCAIRPNDGVQFRVHCGLLEKRSVFERFEYRPPQLGTEINSTGHTVMETEPQSVAVQRLNFNNSWNHNLLQWLYLDQGLAGLRACPIVKQF
jgi:hypothetical protein